MPKYQAPAGETGVNIGGQQFNADDKGVITIPDQGDYRMPEGYVRLPDAPAAAPAASSSKFPKAESAKAE